VRYLVTGAASGMGRATSELLRAQGHEVIGVDLHGSDIDADLGTSEGRGSVVAAAPADLDGAVLCAGLVGLTGRPGSALASVNYFGSVDVLTGLRPKLRNPSSVVLMSSNSVTIYPTWDADLMDACLAGDEQLAREVADRADSTAAYPATKAAIARWVRRSAPSWAADGIRLNALAPGLIETPMTASVAADEKIGPLIGALPVPLGRPGRAEELAALIAFLLSDSGGFFCGSVLLCDGGTEALLRPDDWPARWH
jgi:NAD(P)-dependent dehydrogenase (short-subunit alcohol dehydrogenase family)